MSNEKDSVKTKGLDVVFNETDWHFKGNNYLFLVGIDTYKHWGKLDNAVKDVEDVKKVLLDRYQFQEDHVITLKDKAATDQKILGEIRNLALKLTEQDNLVFYFSGHGFYDEHTKSAYWIPVNAKEGIENEHEFIDTSIIVAKLKAIPTLHTLLIVDACFSGALMTQLRGTATAPRAEQHRSRRVFTSARNEPAEDGVTGTNSPFAMGILESLSKNVQPFLRVSQLILEVTQYLEKEQKHQQVATGVLLNSGDQGGEFVFHLKIHEEELWSKTLEQDTLEGYRRFMDNFPKSEHFEQSREGFLWKEALQKNTIAGFQAYLDEYMAKSGTYVAEAIKKQKQLEEEALWKKATERNTISAYNEFIFKCPESSYVPEAVKRIEAKGSKPAIVTTESRTADPAIPRGFDETTHWEKARNKNNYVAYREFMKAFPESPHASEAETLMNDLENIAVNKVNYAEANPGMDLNEKIAICNAYFRDFPGGRYINQVKQIKDRLEINRIRRQL